MRNITESIYSRMDENANSNKVIFDICMKIDNDQQLADRYFACVKSMQKKDHATISFDRLVDSSTVDSLIRDAAKKCHLTVDTFTRKECRKYVASIILNAYCDESGKNVDGWDNAAFDYAKIDW